MNLGLLFDRRCRPWSRTSRRGKIRRGVSGCGWSIQYGAKGSSTLRTLVSFLSRCQGDRFGFAQLTHPQSTLADILFCSARTVPLLQVGQEPGSARFQHLYQSFSAGIKQLKLGTTAWNPQTNTLRLPTWGDCYNPSILYPYCSCYYIVNKSNWSKK